jgi:hypothetical protein
MTLPGHPFGQETANTGRSGLLNFQGLTGSYILAEKNSAPLLSRH